VFLWGGKGGGNTGRAQPLQGNSRREVRPKRGGGPKDRKKRCRGPPENVGRGKKPSLTGRRHENRIWAEARGSRSEEVLKKSGPPVHALLFDERRAGVRTKEGSLKKVQKWVVWVVWGCTFFLVLYFLGWDCFAGVLFCGVFLSTWSGI